MDSLFSKDFFETAVWTIFIAATAVQILFAVLACRTFSEKMECRPAGVLPQVSVLICARNEAANLRKNLPAILSQDYPAEWEVLVINDASEDESGTVLLEFQRQFSRLRLLDIPLKSVAGKKAGLTQGIETARFNCLLFTDADCAPSSRNWIMQMAGHFAASPQTELVLGYGPLEPPGAGFWPHWTQFEAAHTAMLYCTFARFGQPYMGVGRNLAFKKDLFYRVNGYKSHENILSGDDDLLVNAAACKGNTAVCLAPESFMKSPGKHNFHDWFQQKRRHLSSAPAYRNRHKYMLGLLAMSHTLHFILLLFIILLNFGLIYALAFGLARGIINYLAFQRVSRVLHARTLRSRFPIYDALLAVYYGAFVPIILIGKKTHSWT